MVRPDYCAVDHLQAGVATAAVVEGFEQQLPQAGQRPAPELAVNRRPFAEMFVQVAPGNAGARNPENPIQNKAMISRAPPTARATLDHEWLKTGPFLVAHQTPDQDGLPKSHLESDTGPLGNPLCQHVLVGCSSNDTIHLSCIGNTKLGNGSSFKDEFIIRVSERDMIYWDTYDHRFSVGCPENYLCNFIKTDAAFEEVRTGPDRSRSKIHIDRYTGEYLLTDYGPGEESSKNLKSMTEGMCAKVASPERGKSKF